MPFGFGGGPWWLYNRGYWGYGPYYGWRCFRYPWLPRWWWLNQEYRQNYPYPPQPTLKEEKETLEEELKALREEMRVIESRLKELEATGKEKKINVKEK